MAPLGYAEKAAVKGFLRSKRGERTLHEHVSDALLEYFRAKGITLRELPTTPPATKTDLERWEEEWRDYAVDAGLQTQSDRNNVARWAASAESGTGAGAGARSGKAHAVADALARRGTVIDSAGELTIAAALLDAERGELSAQCRAVEVIWLIYTGELPGEEERTWFNERRQAALLGGAGSDPKVDIRRCKTYIKTLGGSTALTLERALKESTGVVWSRYFQDTTERLQRSGFSAAAGRWQNVVNFARNHYLNDPKKERLYLMHFFFVEKLGIGMPEEVCYKSALMMSAAPATLAASQAFDLRPTVASDLSMPFFQSDIGIGGLGHGMQGFGGMAGAGGYGAGGYGSGGFGMSGLSLIHI